MSLSLIANAKINLGLRIVGQREDPSGPDELSGTGGYHLLHTLFQEIDFGDEVTLTDQPRLKVTLEVTGPTAGGVPTDESNLCLRAARLFKAKVGAGQGVHIRLDKCILVGAGLGGGSSDAAAVLRGLNRMWQVGLSAMELERLALRLGADVPFFIRGGLQLGEGIGEALTPLERELPCAVVLVIPPFSVDTAWAYRQFASRQSFPPPPAFDQLIAREPILWDRLTNDFEDVVFPRYGQLADIKQELLEAGAVHASLSGSGSAVVGLFEAAPNPETMKSQQPDCQVITAKAVARDNYSKD